MSHEQLFANLGISNELSASGSLVVTTPIDGAELGRVAETTVDDVDTIVSRSRSAFMDWRTVPAPRRGELIRLLGAELRAAKDDLGRLVTLENGKIYQEGLGEVQEMIDICDFAVGLSRQLYGLTIASERPGHRMQEVWHPLGVAGVITAFNFPVAVWSWNTAIALVCGDAVVWKPSEKTPLTALACHALLQRATQRLGDVPENLHQLVVGGPSVGEALVDNPGVALVSATGSTRMGRLVGPRVAQRFGRYILELGGNNAMIVAPSGDLNLALRAVVFSAVGTCGQRCTSLRRLIVQESVYDDLVPKLVAAYESVTIGDPLDQSNLVGPIIDGAAYERMETVLDSARALGATVHGGGRVLQDQFPDAFYVRPALVEMPGQDDIVREETFAPILYVVKYRELDEAIAIQNGVPQGLSSCIFSNDVRETETFLSAAGSDCGLVNVNIGPSGAEIGGAFGGEKETGGGRESGSDAWKGYMRRATNTINYSTELPLAQGVKFDL